VSGRIIAIATIAAACYVLIPAVAGWISRFRIKRLVARIASGALRIGAIADVGVNSLSVAFPADGARDGAAIEIDPRETRFYSFDPETGPVPLSWKSVRLVRLDTAVAYLSAPNGLKRCVCVLHPREIAITGASKRIAETRGWRPEEGTGAVKGFSVALGVFLEFLALIEAASNPGNELAEIAALVGVFGKALPYLPPGLILTIAAAKKKRQRNAADFLLVAVGTALNIAVLFFVILRVGFARP
jgi:hypothetical protein